MRKAQALPQFLSTGPDVRVTGGSYTADASNLPKWLPDDIKNQIQTLVAPVEINLTEDQITTLENDILDKLNIKNQVTDMLNDDTQENLKKFHDVMVNNIPSTTNRFNVAEQLHSDFDGYKVEMVMSITENTKNFVCISVNLTLEKKIANTNLQAITKDMIFVSSMESENDNDVQYTAMIGPTGYAIPINQQRQNTSNIRMFGPDTPL